MKDAIVFDQVSFSYGEHQLLSNVSFNIAAGQIHGLLGPNGAGKSTLIKLMSGLLIPDQGTIRVFGHDTQNEPEVLGQIIGLLSDQAPLYVHLTVEEYLIYCSSLKKNISTEIKSRVAELLQELQLTEVKNTLIANLSTGFRQRVALAQTLVHRPKLLILDEPTSGLDPQSSAHFRELLNQLGKIHTILFSSHYLVEVESLCSQVTMINHGEILFHGTMKQALQSGEQHFYHLDLVLNHATLEKDMSHLMEKIVKGEIVTRKNNQLKIKVSVHSDAELTEIVKNIIGTGIIIHEVVKVKAHLEERFLSLVSEGRT